jgi:hypothetical protein
VADSDHLTVSLKEEIEGWLGGLVFRCCREIATTDGSYWINVSTSLASMRSPNGARSPISTRYPVAVRGPHECPSPSEEPLRRADRTSHLRRNLSGLVAVGVRGQTGTRSVPTLVNRGYGRSFFWDGRAASLEQQVLEPIVNPKELDSTIDEAVGSPDTDAPVPRAVSTATRQSIAS